jgi:shikimate dehydrogenase
MMINSKTKLLGVIGHPIGHSLSPLMHNAVFGELNLNSVYLAFDIKPDDLGRFVEGAKAMGFFGMNVTIPHKVEIIKHISEVSKEAGLIGAVNTVKFNHETGKTKGYNTDGLGCVRALEEAGEKISGKNVFILGAGGAARAIVFQCVLEGANVSITNRTEEFFMAVNLKSEIKEKLSKDIKVVDFSNDAIGEALNNSNILIHTTPVGMFPNVDGSIIPGDIIPSHLTVMDIVYNPVETKLLKLAGAKGCKTVPGVGMFVHQGAEAEKIWFGEINPPVDLMKKVVMAEFNKK